MVGGDVFDDGQSQAGAAGGSGAGLVDAKEAFEDALLVFLFDAQATVGDGDFDESAVRAAVEAAADGHRGARWGVGHRVVEQVGQRGDQQGGVAVEQQPGGGVGGDADVGRFTSGSRFMATLGGS